MWVPSLEVDPHTLIMDENTLSNKMGNYWCISLSITDYNSLTWAVKMFQQHNTTADASYGPTTAYKQVYM